MKLERIISHPGLTVDRYDSLAWITLFSETPPEKSLQKKLHEKGIDCAITIRKSKSKLPGKPTLWFGKAPLSFVVEEYGVKYEIRTDTTHPGLFLDHSLTRKWLVEHAADKTVLNLFSYTGSLGISAAVGGAKETTNIDLSNSATSWAKKNSELNGLQTNHQFIKGDVFDWMKRFKKKQRTFDVVISDPPSQSRSDEMHFSTEKHLDMLHELCIPIVAPGGILITSINTETISEKALVASVKSISKKLNRKIQEIETLAVPSGFDSQFRSMKGIRIFFRN